MSEAEPIEPNGGSNVRAGAPSGRRWGRLLPQLVGFLAGLGLLAWCVTIALGPENREQLQKLRGATLGQIAALLGLSFTSLMISGVVFHLTVRPVHPLRRADVCSTNAISSFLGYLPLKLGLLLRIAVHVRRDRMSLLEVGGWFGAVTVPILMTAGCLAGATLVTHEVNQRWYLLAGGGLLAGSALVVLAARLMGGESGRARMRRPATSVHQHWLDRFIAGEHYGKLNTGTVMLGSPRVVGWAVALRVLDFFLQAQRFVIAARIIGLALPTAHAFVVASSAFLIGIVSPGGPVGAREAGVVGVLKLLGVPDPKTYVIVPLLVTATEAVAYLGAAIAGLAWLGPGRLFVPRGTR